MSAFQNFLKYINEDFIAPTVRLIVMSKKEILLNKIVPKNSSIREIFKNEGLKEGKQYTLSGKPLNLDDKVIDIIPKNYNTLSNIELIIEEINLLIENNKIYYERLLKPYENPFRVLVFTPNEFDVSIKSYPNETIDLYQLYNYSDDSSSYCNTPKDLYISGGKVKSLGGKSFWRINSVKTNIEKLKDLPLDKENHSMIFIPSRYIYIIGGNNKNTFYYDELFDTFTSWAEMNKPVKKPSLILLNNTFIYSFGEQTENSINDFFERTNLKSNNASWESLILKNQFLPVKDFGVAMSDDNEIYFLGGRKERGEKVYKFNLSTQQIEKCKQENTSLKPTDKNFYPLNDYNYAMIPDSKIDKNIQVVIFNKKRKKYRKVLYEKNLDETVNNYDISLEDSLIRENNQIKIVWKEFQNNYINIDDLPENMLYLPTIEDLKKAGEENYNENNGYEIENNIYNNDNQNVFREGRNKKHKKDDSFKPPTFTDQEKFEQIQDTNDNNLNIIQKEKDLNEGGNKLLMEKITFQNEDDKNNERYINSPVTLKQIFDGKVNDNINLKIKSIEYPSINQEINYNINTSQNKNDNDIMLNMPNINNEDENLNINNIFLDKNNKSIDLLNLKLGGEQPNNPYTLKGLFNGDINPDENIQLKINKPVIKDIDGYTVKGIILNENKKDEKEPPINLFRKKTILDSNKKNEKYDVDDSNNKVHQRAKTNIGRGNFEFQIPDISIEGEKEGKKY